MNMSKNVNKKGNLNNKNKENRDSGTNDQNLQSLTSGGAVEPDPFEINFLPEFREGRGPQEPFINEYGVLIGDHMYASPHSPLEQWTEETDPEIMSGDIWVHPYKDIGFHSAENKDYFEKGILPGSAHFMHPHQDVAFGMEPDKTVDEEGGESEEKEG